MKNDYLGGQCGINVKDVFTVWWMYKQRIYRAHKTLFHSRFIIIMLQNHHFFFIYLLFSESHTKFAHGICKKKYQTQANNMNFQISKGTRRYVQSTTGHTYDELISMSLNEGGKVNPNDFSPFRDSGTKEIPSRGSVFLQMKMMARLKDVSRRFFNF